MNTRSESDIERELDGLVAQISRRYARKCWWADEGDLRQEGWIAAIEARKTWDRERALAPYAATAIRRAIAAYLLKQSAPVSASWHDRHALYGLQRAQLEALEVPPAPGTRQGAPDGRGWADDLLEHQRWRVRVLARLLAVIGDEGAPGLDALIGEMKRVGRPPRWLIESIAHAETKIGADEELKALWNERGDK